MGQKGAVLMRAAAECRLLLTDVRVSVDVYQQGRSGKEETRTRRWTGTFRGKSCCKQRFRMSSCLRARARPGAAAWLFIECNASSKGSKSSGRLLGFGENYGNAGEMDEQHFITINQRLLINKVHFLFSMIQGIIKRTLSLSF